MVADFTADWNKHGKAAVASLRRKNVAAYARLAISLLPRESIVTLSDYGDASDEELRARLDILLGKARDVTPAADRPAPAAETPLPPNRNGKNHP